MARTLTDDLDEYAAVAGGFLASRPVQHTIPLTVIETLRAGRRAGRGAGAEQQPSAAVTGAQPPLFGWWRDNGGSVLAALLHTPPYPLLLTGLPAGSAVRLVGELAGRGRQLRGVLAAENAAAEFAAAWSVRTGMRSEPFRRELLYQLGELRPPSPAPPGQVRVGTPADLELLERWLDYFAAELADLGSHGAGWVADRIGFGGLTLWECGGEPVALAGVNRPAAGVARIGPVYTPPAHRGRGFGAAVTAAVSRAARAAGATDVVLFTNAANPSSNALYQRIGYQQVAVLVVLSFAP